MGRRMQSEQRTIPISGVTSLKYQNKLSFEKANLLKKSGAFVFLPFFFQPVNPRSNTGGAVNSAGQKV